MPRERSVQPVSSGEPDVDHEGELLAHDVWRPPGVDAAEIDSQIVITLLRGERVPQAQCTKAGRMTGQMIMGLEGSGMYRIDTELRRAQLEYRRANDMIPKPNTRSLEDRVMQTPENSNG